jgi:hypothetical protein
MKKIIWISSYPKSGNTFLRAMLSAFFYSEDGIFKQDYLKNIAEFPRDFFKLKPSNNFLNEVEEYKKIQKKISNTNKKIIFLKTHLANLTVNKIIPTINKDYSMCAIYIVRDPRNVILSLKNHYNLKIKECLSFLMNNKNFICIQNKDLSKGYTPILDWSSNYLSWKKQSNVNTIFIKFEDLIFNQENTFIYILNKLKKFINLEIDQKKIDNIVKTTKFKYLRQLEEKEGFIENKIMGIQNNNSFFFNKGGEQDFNKDLEKNIIDEINKKYKELLLEFNYLKN